VPERGAFRARRKPAGGRRQQPIRRARGGYFGRKRPHHHRAFARPCLRAGPSGCVRRRARPRRRSGAARAAGLGKAARTNLKGAGAWERTRERRCQSGLGTQGHAAKAAASRALGHVGMAISHASPSARQSKRISPFIFRIMPSITRVPKPRRVGGVAGGPPASIQRSTTLPSIARDHSTSTFPVGTDNAPYLAALVASSCKVTAIVWAVSGSRDRRFLPHLVYNADLDLALLNVKDRIRRVALRVNFLLRLIG
jgi:hypothetical protein